MWMGDTQLTSAPDTWPRVFLSLEGWAKMDFRWTARARVTGRNHFCSLPRYSKFTWLSSFYSHMQSWFAEFILEKLLLIFKNLGRWCPMLPKDINIPKSILAGGHWGNGYVSPFWMRKRSGPGPEGHAWYHSGGPRVSEPLALGFCATRSATTWQFPSGCESSHTLRKSLQIKWS